MFGRDPVFPGWQRIPVAGRECVGGAVREAQLAAKEMNAGMKTDILIVGYVVYPSVDYERKMGSPLRALELAETAIFSIDAVS